MGSKDLPIFDGGISVYQGIFLISYRDTAEYIRIHDGSSPKDVRSVTRIKLWDHEPSRERSSSVAAAPVEEEKASETESRASFHAGTSNAPYTSSAP